MQVLCKKLYQSDDEELVFYSLIATQEAGAHSIRIWKETVHIFTLQGWQELYSAKLENFGGMRADQRRETLIKHHEHLLTVAAAVAFASDKITLNHGES